MQPVIKYIIEADIFDIQKLSNASGVPEALLRDAISGKCELPENEVKKLDFLFKQCYIKINYL